MIAVGYGDGRMRIYHVTTDQFILEENAGQGAALDRVLIAADFMREVPERLRPEDTLDRAVALFAEGTTTITGVAHIRHKETDRIADLGQVTLLDLQIAIHPVLGEDLTLGIV